MNDKSPTFDAGRRAALLGIGAALAALLGACGKKGDLEPPPEAGDRRPRSYPKPQ